MNAESQRKVILHMLETGRGVTALEALRACGSMRLAARIWELRDAGHVIETDMVLVGKKRVASYRLVRDSLWGVLH